MGIIFEESVQHARDTSLPVGGGGTDNFRIVIPVGEGYEKTEIEVYRDKNSSGARVIDEPRNGESGNLHVNVRWWYDFAPFQDLVYYNIKIFSKTTEVIGEPGRIFLFEHNHFEGRYREVFNGEVDLTLNEQGYFNDQTSSIIITKGNWAFYKNIDFNSPYTYNNRIIVLGPGMYPDVRSVGIANDELSSLMSVTESPNHP